MRFREKSSGFSITSASPRRPPPCGAPPSRAASLNMRRLLVQSCALLNSSAGLHPGRSWVKLQGKSMPRGAEAWSVSPSLTLYHLHKCHKRRKGQIMSQDNYEKNVDLADILVILGTPTDL